VSVDVGVAFTPHCLRPLWPRTARVYVDNLVSAAGQVMRACVLMLLMLAQLTLKCTAAAADDEYRCKTATKRSFLLVIIFTWSSSISKIPALLDSAQNLLQNERYN